MPCRTLQVQAGSLSVNYVQLKANLFSVLFVRSGLRRQAEEAQELLSPFFKYIVLCSANKSEHTRKIKS